MDQASRLTWGKTVKLSTHLNQVLKDYCLLWISNKMATYLNLTFICLLSFFIVFSFHFISVTIYFVFIVCANVIVNAI